MGRIATPLDGAVSALQPRRLALFEEADSYSKLEKNLGIREK